MNKESNPQTAALDSINAWVGWELWECDHSSIRLDGEFTAEQLEAIASQMRQGAATALSSASLAP